MIVILTLILLFATWLVLFINQVHFGKQPSGERKIRVDKSKNYKNGKFKYKKKVSLWSGKDNVVQKVYELVFPKKERLKPKGKIPTIKTDLSLINKKENVAVWFGHSSLFFQLDGLSFLIDPVFSEKMGPLSFYGKAFEGTNIYNSGDMPEIDCLIVTHDHWDHLDYDTIIGLKTKINKVICPLGVGENFEYWGFEKNKIVELDWNENYEIKNNYKIYAFSSRHFSGRGLFQNKSLWASFLVQSSSNYKLFISGDLGYDDNFKDIGKQFGSIDLAVVEDGQYSKNWKNIHLFPEEVRAVTNDLNAKRLLPVHNSKFILSEHTWDEPLESIFKLSKGQDYILLTPKIGEKIDLNSSTYNFSDWWKNVE